MPLRKTVLATGEIYHVFNRSVQGIPIFKGKSEYEIFKETIRFYLQPEPPARFSVYRAYPTRFKIDLTRKIVTIINFCLMPNHFHFTLRQEEENGIRNFIQRISNSFAHYFALKYQNPRDYPYSSYLAYLGEGENELVDPAIILEQFASPKQYEEFVLDRKDYQRSLEAIKHLITGDQ